MDENAIMNSHDVVSLFANVPIKKAMEVIKKKLEEEKNLSNQTNLDTYDLISLVEFLMSSTYFQYYQQGYDAPMGSQVYVVMSDMFMEHLEEEAMDTALPDMRLKTWHQYTDDSFEVVRRKRSDELTSHHNTIDKTGSIKFTDESEKDGSIPFLDALISRMTRGVKV